MIKTYKNNIPCQPEGFGVPVNHYASGRLSASVAGHGGLLTLNYCGIQDHRKLNFFEASPLSSFGKLGRVLVLIDSKAYFPEFFNTQHYPFGYRSECVLDDVKIQHELILAGNTAYQYIRVLDNPKGHEIRARLLLHGHLWVKVADRTKTNWAINPESGELSSTVVDKGSDGRETITEVTVGANVKCHSESRHEPFKYYMETVEAAEEIVFHITFSQNGEKNDKIVVGDIIPRFEEKLKDGLCFETGNETLDSALTNTVPMVMALAVKDRPGAMRASQHYWVWGWDSMVHAEAMLWAGETEIVRDMLDFYRETADPEKGVAHALNTDFELILAMAPSAQCLYVVMLHNYYAATGDEETLKRNLPFARNIIKSTIDAQCEQNSLSKGLGFYPDFPQLLGQTNDNLSLINNSLYYQALRAIEELTNDVELQSKQLRTDMETILWDSKDGYWIDSVSVQDLSPRNYYPLYGQLYVSPFGTEPKADKIEEIANFMENNFLFERGLYMFPTDRPGFMADGNQLGAYYPSVDRYYWNIMNLSKNSKSVADFERIVTSYWTGLSYPEGMTHETVNVDPTCDNPGGKQAFAAKAWCCDALELYLGLQVGVKGLTLSPMPVNHPFAVHNLCLRGKLIDVKLSGHGSQASYTLNGVEIDGSFISWDVLQPTNSLIIQMKD